MKIIGICGSPRKDGNTEILLKEALKSVEELGAETELILLRDMKIEFCDGCLECDKTGKCHFDDDMNEVNEKLASAEGLIIGSPARFDLLSGDLKVFMDRTNPIYKSLAGKKAGIIVVGQCKGKEIGSIRHAVQSIKFYCTSSDIDVVGTVIAPGILEKGEVSKNKKVLTDARKLGKKIVKSIEK